MTALNPRTARIRALNDALRSNHVGGRIVLTRGVAALSPTRVAEIVAAVGVFDDFDDDNDPHGEHDFGSVIVAGVHAFFKIDYFDPLCSSHSADSADDRITERVMTIMLSEEY